MTAPDEPRPRLSNTAVVAAAVAMSAAVVAGLIWLIYFFQVDSLPEDTLLWLPNFNAACNATCALLLVLGYRAIRAGKRDCHIRLMIGATVASGLFLVGYLLHHALHGDTRFVGAPWVRTAYLVLLASHVLTAIVALPLVFSTLAFAWLGRYGPHRRVSRWTLPLWLYVSVTGVLVWAALRIAG